MEPTDLSSVVSPESSTPVQTWFRQNARLIVPVVVCLAILFMLFGQYLIGPPNVHSARTLALIVEAGVLIAWLLSSPEAYLWKNSRLFRWIFGVWLLVGFLGVFTASYNSASALVGQLEWMSHLFFIVALVDFHAKKLILPVDLFKGATWAGVAILSYFVYRWNILADPRGYDWGWGPIPFINIRHLAYFILPAFISSLYVTVVTRGWTRKIHFAFAVPLLALLFWAAGRASLAAALITLLVVFAYLIFIEKFSKKVLFTLMFGVLVAFALSQSFSVDHPALNHFSSNQKDMETSQKDMEVSLDAFSSGRVGIWQAQINNMTFGDVLIGQGVDNYKFIPDRADATIHPHSWFVQAWSSWGIIVTALIIIGTLFVIFNLIRNVFVPLDLNDKRDNFFLLSVLSASLALSMFDGNLYNSWSVSVFATFFASALYHSSPKVSLNNEDSTGRSLSSWWLYGTAVLIVMIIIHLINNLTVFGRTVPKPSDWRTSVVMAIPYNTVTVDAWLDVWQKENPAEMLRLLTWLQKNSPHAYRFMLIEADLLDGAGYEKEALQKLDDAIAVSPKNARLELLEFREKLSSE